MKVKEFSEKLTMKILTGGSGLNREIRGMYACDLLSWVMSHANKESAWVTVHTHLNVIAVALLLEIPCIIVPEGIIVEEATIKKAVEEDIAILSTEMDAYEVCWRGHQVIESEE